MTRAERLRLEAAEREAMRLRGWLGFVSWRARGMGRALAQQAIYSNAWAPVQPAARRRKHRP